MNSVNDMMDMIQSIAVDVPDLNITDYAEQVAALNMSTSLEADSAEQGDALRDLV